MTFARVGTGVSGGDQDGDTTPTYDTTGASLIVIWIGYYPPSGAPTVSDSKGNTWTALTPREGSDFGGRMYYAINPTVGSGHTFTVAGTTSFGSIAVQAYSDALTASPLDQTTGAVVTTGATIQPGSITPTENDELVVVGLTSAGSLSSINGGFSEAVDLAFSGGVNYGVALADLVQTSAAAANPTLTPSTSNALAATIASFKKSAGGGGGSSIAAIQHSYRQRRAA